MKIAVLITLDQYTNYGDDHNVVANSITEWADVSKEDYEILRNNLPYGHIILTQPDEQKIYINTLLEQAKAQDKKLKAQRDAAKLAAEKAAKAKKAKIEARELKKLAELKEKYEN